MTSPAADTSSDALPWRHGDACVIAHFRLTPRSSREAIDGFVETAEGTAIQARVRAPPEDGAANKALEALVARWLGVPKSSIALVAGGKSRVKTVRIAGQPALLERILAERMAKFQKQSNL